MMRSAIRCFVADITVVWDPVHYTVVNDVLWGVGICLIGFPLLGLVLVHLLYTRRDRRRHLGNYLSRRRLGVHYRRPSGVRRPPDDATVTVGDDREEEDGMGRKAAYVYDNHSVVSSDEGKGMTVTIPDEQFNGNAKW